MALNDGYYSTVIVCSLWVAILGLAELLLTKEQKTWIQVQLGRASDLLKAVTPISITRLALRKSIITFIRVSMTLFALASAIYLGIHFLEGSAINTGFIGTWFGLFAVTIAAWSSLYTTFFQWLTAPPLLARYLLKLSLVALPSIAVLSLAFPQLRCAVASIQSQWVLEFLFFVMTAVGVFVYLAYWLFLASMILLVFAIPIWIVARISEFILRRLSQYDKGPVSGLVVVVTFIGALAAYQIARNENPAQRVAPADRPASASLGKTAAELER